VFIEPDQIGERLRTERMRRGLSQRKLAQLIGVSPSLISQMESAKVQPSVATLMSVVTELGLSIDQLFRANGTDSPPATLAAEDVTTATQQSPGTTTQETGDPSRDVQPAGAPGTRTQRMVQRSSDRSMIRLNGGVTWERLTPDPDHLVDFLYITYDPGASSAEGTNFLRHEGREYLYVLSGQLDVQVVFDAMVLMPGDSIAFDSMRPHRFTNNGHEPAVAVVAVVHP
jgi:transcriptional regulator with XRE-family HTH domain